MPRVAPFSVVAAVLFLAADFRSSFLFCVLENR